MLEAKIVLDAAHPLHQVFVKWLAGATPTKRKAREFKAAFPMLFDPPKEG